MTELPTNPSTDPRDILRKRVESKLQQNQNNIERLSRDKKRLPWLLLLFVLTVPAGFFWGFTGAALVAACTIFAYASAIYLWWGHKTEYEQKNAALRAELRKLGS